jgi:hypothetical protein
MGSELGEGGIGGDCHAVARTLFNSVSVSYQRWSPRVNRVSMVQTLQITGAALDYRGSVDQRSSKHSPPEKLKP